MLSIIFGTSRKPSLAILQLLKQNKTICPNTLSQLFFGITTRILDGNESGGIRRSEANTVDAFEVLAISIPLELKLSSRENERPVGVVGRGRAMSTGGGVWRICGRKFDFGLKVEVYPLWNKNANMRTFF